MRIEGDRHGAARAPGSKGTHAGTHDEPEDQPTPERQHVSARAPRRRGLHSSAADGTGRRRRDLPTPRRGGLSLTCAREAHARTRC